MSDHLEYKGYEGSVLFNAVDQVFYGRVEAIKALVSYEGTDVSGLQAAFQEAVDDYCALCEEQGKLPEKPYKGSFNVRTGPDLHRRLALVAEKKGVSLNKLVTESLEQYLKTG